MTFKETKLQGSFIVESEMLIDERGAFSRTFCRRDFENHGLNGNISQCSISLNKKKNTLRGMHYQKYPHAEAKLVRCSRGLIYDVIVDLRENSPSKNEWISIELTESNHKMIYVPEGFAHGFQTLEENSEVFYQMSVEYSPEYARIKKSNDHKFNILWPILPPILSERDKNGV